MTQNSLIIHKTDIGPQAVVTGCPVQSTDFDDNCEQIWLNYSDGETIPAQLQTLISETSQGTRWLELSFICERPGEVELTGDPAPLTGEKIAVNDNAGVILSNTKVNVAVNRFGAKAPLEIQWGKNRGSFRPEIVTGNSLIHSETNDCERRVKVLRNGTIRGQVEVSGQFQTADGMPSFGYRLTVEVWKNLPAVRIDFRLSHCIAGIRELNVERASLLGCWNVGNATQRAFLQPKYGPYFKSRVVENPEPVTLISDDTCYPVHVADPAMLLDDSDYPFYCAPPLIGTGDWLRLDGSNGGVCLSVIDFAETRPNALSSTGSSLDYHLIPEGNSLNWPQGRRREQTLMLSFYNDQKEKASSVDELRRIWSYGQATPPPETLLQHDCFSLSRVLPPLPDSNIRLNMELDKLLQLRFFVGKWDLGDTPDWNYTGSYAGIPNMFYPKPEFPGLQATYSVGGKIFPPVKEQMLEPVWTNNEYDFIHALVMEVMRTGKPDLLTFLRWTARHNIDVDFVEFSDDPWHHQASPFHSHCHNKKGAISSHFWTQGLLQYYCLTGDRDALDVSLALGDKIVEINNSSQVRTWKFDREIGWALLALSCLMEMGFEQFRPEADKMADFLQNYDRKKFAGAVKLSAGKPGRSLERQMLDCGFGYASMLEAFDRYQAITGRKDTKKWLEELLMELKKQFWIKTYEGELPTIRNMIGLIMEIGYEHLGDDDFLKAGLLMIEHYLDEQKHSPDNRDQIKPAAMVYRGLNRILGALQRKDMLSQFEFKTLQ